MEYHALKEFISNPEKMQTRHTCKPAAVRAPPKSGGGRRRAIRRKRRKGGPGRMRQVGRGGARHGRARERRRAAPGPRPTPVT